MQITRLECKGIFSFGVGVDRFGLDLDEGLTVVVGPNASGKSNISRALNLLQSAVRFEDANNDDRLALYTVMEDHVRNARHEGMPANAHSSVRLGIRLQSRDEIALVTSYVQALVIAALLGSQSPDDPSISVLESWVAEHVTSEEITDLFEGTVVISHSGIRGTTWNVAYEFVHNGMPLAWHIQTSIPNLRATIAPLDRTAADGLPPVQMLTQRLTGGVDRPPGDFTPPEAPFTFDALVPNEESLVRVEMASVNANVPPAPHRAFVAAAGITIPGGDVLGPFRRSYGLAAVLSRVLDAGLRYLGTAGASLELPSGGMGLIANSDPQPSSPVPRSDALMLPWRLIELKNGDQAAQTRYRGIQALFTELAPGHRFEMHSFQRQGGSDSPERVVEVEVFPSGPTDHSAVEPRPLRFAGTGVEQALILAETLVGSPDRVLMLDEPATNLHPPWQQIVRSHLCTREGQCVLLTHSPFLIPSENREQLATIVRFGLRNGATHGHRLNKEDLADDRWIGTMVKELAWSADARGLLFAGGVVLLEGETELGALPSWFATSPTASRFRGPSELHVVFYSVGGGQSFRTFISHLDRFGVPWAVICDGASFRFTPGMHIFEQVLSAGVDDEDLAKYVAQEEFASKEQRAMDASLFTSMVETGKNHRIFSLAPGWQTKNEVGGDNESFEAFIGSKADLIDPFESAKKDAPRSKPRAGRLLAESTACPQEVDDLYGDILSRLWQQGMARYPDL